MKLSNADCDAMDAFLEAVLNAYRDGRTNLLNARLKLAHAMTAAAKGNKGEFEKYIRNPED